MEEHNKKITVAYEPYGDLIYVLKTFLEIKGIMEVTSGDYIIRETDLTESLDYLKTKETDLLDCNNIQNTFRKIIDQEYVDSDSISQTSFNEMCDEFSKFLSQDSDATDIKETQLTDNDVFYAKETDLTLSDNEELTVQSEHKETSFLGEEIKETSLSGDKPDEKSSLTNDFTITTSDRNAESIFDEQLKETDLTGSDTEFEGLYSSKSSLENLQKIEYLQLENDETERIKTNVTRQDNGRKHNRNIRVNTAENIETTIYDKKNIETKSYNNEIHEADICQESEIKFQDLDSDFFETDCESAELTSVFETPKYIATATTGESFSDPKRKKREKSDYFQDIESDFFEDEVDIPNEKDVCTKQNGLKVPNHNVKNTNSKEPKGSGITKQGKAVAMSNSLLRATISELERALNDSNVLLSKRDKKIQELRNRNKELKKNLSQELESHSKVKLLLLKKEALLSDRELKILELQREVEIISTELSELRLHKLNNFHRPAETNYERQSHFTEKQEPMDALTENKSLNSSLDTSRNVSTCGLSCSFPSCNSTLTKSHTSCKYKKQKSEPIHSAIHSTDNRPKCSDTERNPRQLNPSSETRSCRSQSMTNSTDETVNKNELHTNLRMRFMRDAFFYYMIGFHPDEQINAILAILEYGDKRQDFVLEAHKMKQLGKKFNVTKVSTRGLTFTQEQQSK